jgi:glycosyltransferase involved in cell wall biosynthesis
MIIDFILSEYSLPFGKVFNPLNLNDDPIGISGTEINLFGNAFELAKRGHKVRIFSKWTEECEYNNVSFIQIENTIGYSDVAIAYHDGRPLRNWATDFKIALHQTFEIAEGIDTSKADLYLSATYVNMKHHFNRDFGRWAILPNACDFGKYHKWNPKKGRMIFHTDPSRGLHVLLRALPEIKKQVPEANLHIYSKIVLDTNRYHYKYIYNEIIQRLEECKEYITIHNRSFSKNELLEEISKAAVFAYPSEPPRPCEVFPISVMECCATGVPVVLSPADGIEEIYKNAVDIVPSPPSNYLNQFINATVKVLTDDNYAKGLSNKGLNWLKDFSFNETANILEDLINKYKYNQEVKLSNEKQNKILYLDCPNIILCSFLEMYPYIKKEIKDLSFDNYGSFRMYYKNYRNNEITYINNCFDKLYNFGVTCYNDINLSSLYNEISKSKIMICSSISNIFDIKRAISLNCLPVIIGKNIYKDLITINNYKDIVNLLKNDYYYQECLNNAIKIL